MYENKTGRLIRCPECFAKDIDVFLLYDEKKDEYIKKFKENEYDKY